MYKYTYLLITEDILYVTVSEILCKILFREMAILNIWQ